MSNISTLGRLIMILNLKDMAPSQKLKKHDYRVLALNFHFVNEQVSVQIFDSS